MCDDLLVNRRCLPLALSLLGALACTPVAPSTGLVCEHDQECATGRCVDGRCVPSAHDGGGVPVDDAGHTDGGPHTADAGRVDAGPGDAGSVDDGGARDGGAHDGGRRDSGVPPDLDDGGASPADASVPDEDGGAPGIDAGAGCVAAPPIVRAPIEVCDDGWDNDGDGDVDERPCGQMRNIIIAPGANVALPAGYSVAVPVSTLFGADGDDEEPDGDDVRVWRYDGGGFSELHRVLDPDESWGAPSTLWFALPAASAAGAPIAGPYRLTWGALPDAVNAPALADEREVFPFADYFEWGPSEDGSPRWTFADDPGDEDIDIVNGALTFVAANERDGKPHALATFPALAGTLRFDVRFHWAGSDGNGDDYAWRLLLGDAQLGTPSTNDELDPAHVGPNLLWSGGMPSFDDWPFPHALAVDGQDPDPDDAEDGIRVLGESGFSTSTRLIIDADTTTKQFSVQVGGASYGPFRFADESVSSFARLRIFTAELSIDDDSGFDPARFEHVILRHRVRPEPEVELRAHAPCE